MKTPFHLLAAALAALVWTATGAAAGDPAAMTVYKTPWCGCCTVWTDAMKKAGYQVRIEHLDDLSPIKRRAGVAEPLEACHTAILSVAGKSYAVEGHVPLEAIAKLVSEKPAIKGIAVPGMPAGSLGMGHDPKARYDVLSFAENPSAAPKVFYKAGE